MRDGADPKGPPAFPLGSEQLHVWAVSCDDPPAPLAWLRSLLSAEERRRAERYRFEADQRRAVVGRGALRALLGAYLGTGAARLPIGAGAHGKPELEEGVGEGLRFNLSHAGGWALIGLTRDREVGVDVERVRVLPDLDRIVESCFSPREAIRIRALAEPARTAAFFRGWVCKEAYAKAIGMGLGLALERVEVAPDRTALHALDGSADAAARWTLWTGSPAPGYVAAAAAGSHGIATLPLRWTAGRTVRGWTP